MDFPAQYRELLDQLPQPAFLLQDGTVIYQNAAGVLAEVDLDSLMELGLPDPPAVLSRGCWSFTLRSLGRLVLVLASIAPEHPILPESVSAMRIPLSQLFSAASALMPTLEDTEDPAILRRAAVLNQNLYRLRRALSNIDFFQDPCPVVSTSRVNLSALLRELADAIPNPCTASGVTLALQLPPQDVYLLTDRDLLERAVLNLLSNAFRHADSGSAVILSLKKQQTKLVLSVFNHGLPPEDPALLFGEKRTAITGTAGLGLDLVRSIVRLLNATFLFQMQDGGCAATLAFPPDLISGPGLCSPTLKIDFSGGFSRTLMELSDVLPISAFLPMAID